MKVHGRSISIEWICWVGVGEELGEERLEYVREIIEGSPGLVDHIQADGA